MVQARTRIMNQLQAVALNEGLRCKKRLWQEHGRQQLESFRLAPWASRRHVNCGLHLYNTGDSFIENNNSHDIWNVAPVPVRLMVTYILPKGAIRRLESDAPPCAAALGLQ